MSLSKPHPIWSTPGSSPSKIAMATIQAQIVSGRYRTQKLCSHWYNDTATCPLSDTCSPEIEDLQHILTKCIALQTTRNKLLRFTFEYCYSRCSRPWILRPIAPTVLSIYNWLLYTAISHYLCAAIWPWNLRTSFSPYPDMVLLLYLLYYQSKQPLMILQGLSYSKIWEYK